MRGRFLIFVVLLILSLAAVRLSPAPEAAAQEGDPCEALTQQAIAAALEACAATAPGEACYGFAQVGESELLGAAGDRAALADLATLSTSGADTGAGTWGIAVAMLPGGTAESAAHVTAVLFGDARMARPAQAAGDRPTLPVFNGGSAPINLRNGAGITYDMVGQLAPQEQAAADGRNEQADWLRIQFAGGTAWVFTPLINWEGDQSAINALDVLLPNDVTPAATSGEPFQSFALVTGSAPATCAAAPSGLLLDYSGADPARLQINQIDLEIAGGLWFVAAAENDAAAITVLSGEGTVTARGVDRAAAAGDTIRVSLGGDDGLTPLAAPEVGPSLAFTVVANLPLDLAPTQLACRVGLPAGSARVAMRVGPGSGRGELGDLRADTTYAAVGWTNDPEGAPWWQLDTGGQLAWVPQADVRTIGMCREVAEVEAPPLVAVPVAPAGDGAAPGPDLAPTTNSVWQMVPGSDNLIGQCSGAPAINFCDHLAAISPAAGGISWRGMEASPYFLSQVQPNTYSYSGRNVLGTGQVTMTLTFSGETSLNMTMSLVLDSEPDCQHVYYYTGTKNW